MRLTEEELQDKIEELTSKIQKEKNGKGKARLEAERAYYLTQLVQLDEKKQKDNEKAQIKRKFAMI